MGIRSWIKRSLQKAGYEVRRSVTNTLRIDNPTTEELRRGRFLRELGVDLLLDVGANTGQYALGARRGGYRGNILSFEPITSVFDQLETNAKRDDKWRCLKLGVGDRHGSAVINVAANNGESSSLLDMNQRHRDAAPEADYNAKEEIVVAPLDDIVRDHFDAPNRVWLKIDVQGYEKFVLAGAEKVLSSTLAIERELSVVELYEGQDLIEASISDLRRAGFHLAALEEAFVDPLTNQALQFSGIFIRPSKD